MERPRHPLIALAFCVVSLGLLVFGGYAALESLLRGPRAAHHQPQRAGHPSEPDASARNEDNPR